MSRSRRLWPPTGSRPSRLLATALLTAALGAASIAVARAVSDPAEMLPNPAEEKRAELLGAQLRCLVCQNESIEDSDADLARDLRHVLRVHVAAGESNRQIMRWMVARYGSFIRLRPAFTLGTALLWAMPLLALLCGLLVALLAARRNRLGDAAAPVAARALDPAEQAALRAILRDTAAER